MVGPIIRAIVGAIAGPRTDANGHGLQTVINPPKKVPAMWINYCRKTAELTGVPLPEVMGSEPAQEYLRRLTQEVEV